MDVEIYIPDNLYNNIQNSFKVYNLLEKYYGTDILVNEDDNTLKERFYDELKRLNEPKVVEYLKTVI